MRVLRFQISMFLTGRLAPCFGLEKIFQMMAWRVMTHAVADSFWGTFALESAHCECMKRCCTKGKLRQKASKGRTLMS